MWIGASGMRDLAPARGRALKWTPSAMGMRNVIKQDLTPGCAMQDFPGALMPALIRRQPMNRFCWLLLSLITLLLVVACAIGPGGGREVDVPPIGSIPPGIPADVLRELSAVQPEAVGIVGSPEWKFSGFEDGRQFSCTHKGGRHCISNLVYGWTRCFRYYPGRMRTDDNNDKYVVVEYGASFEESFLRSAYYPKLIILDFKTGKELGVVERPGRVPENDDTDYLEPIAVRGNRLYYQIGPCCRDSSLSERAIGVITLPSP